MQHSFDPKNYPLPNRTRELTDTVARLYTGWLETEDREPIYAVLGAYFANLMSSDPVWLMIVAPPASGKTELLKVFDGMRKIYKVDHLTEGALLSAFGLRARPDGATGGLLKSIERDGGTGILVFKDFSTLLELHKDTRGQVLAALRRLHDGGYTKHTGMDGGVTFEWAGHVGVLAAATPQIERYYSVMGSLGQRFLLLRLHAGAKSRKEQAKSAIGNVGTEEEMRSRLREACAAMEWRIKVPDSPPLIPAYVVDRIAALAALVATARSDVGRDGRSRIITAVYEPEGPARLAKQLSGFYQGLKVVGLENKEAWEIVRRVGLDSIPDMRRRVLDPIMASEFHAQTTSDLRNTTGLPEKTLSRQLEELEALGALLRNRGMGPISDKWSLGDEVDEHTITVFEPFLALSPVEAASQHGLPTPSEKSQEAASGEMDEEEKGFVISRAHKPRDDPEDD